MDISVENGQITETRTILDGVPFSDTLTSLEVWQLIRTLPTLNKHVMEDCEEIFGHVSSRLGWAYGYDWCEHVAEPIAARDELLALLSTLFVESNPQVIFEILHTDESSRKQGRVSQLLLYGNALVRIDSGSTLLLNIMTSDRAALMALAEHLGQVELHTDPPAEDEVEINFWYKSGMGARCEQRKLVCPSWVEIDGNYSTNQNSAVAELAESAPDRSGIILWTGAAGAGKTTALRALMREWGEDISPNVIADPEVFLNDIGYIQQIMLSDDNRYDDEGNEIKSVRPLVLILEDSGELLASDARDRVGQGLSRLLNLTDGMLGQGRKIVIVITTNEKQQDLHQAIMRPGRALSIIEFQQLNTEESDAWRVRRGLAPAGSAATLAELYEELRIGKVVTE